MISCEDVRIGRAPGSEGAVASRGTPCGQFANRRDENPLRPAQRPNRPQATRANPVVNGPLRHAQQPARLVDQHASADLRLGAGSRDGLTGLVHADPPLSRIARDVPRRRLADRFA